jgi:hypothetical protein
VSLDAAPPRNSLLGREQQEQRQQGLQKGKLISTKVPVLCAKVLWRGGDPVVTFTTVFRANIHKHAIYKERS